MYIDEIPRLLSGKSRDLQDIPQSRLDWAGCSAVLELFDQTSGQAREEIIRSMGHILETATQPAPILADIVYIAACLDLSQIEPSVKTLQGYPVATAAVLRQAIHTYLAFRAFRQASLP